MAGKQLSTKTVVAIGIGAAVFVILGRFASIPTGIPNTQIETSYAFLALMAVLFGPVAGALIGFIGHLIKDATLFGPWWSWIIVSGFVGLMIGFISKRLNVEEGIFGLKKIIFFNVVQVITQAIGWFVIAPILDIVIYAEPVNKVFLQGFAAGISNIITVGVIGTIIIAAYARTRSKSGSLTKETS
ncbi:ECF-type riboflavin transporter substrate-binding protein [Bacillus sp. 179-C3.3 HS]|uniref:ECF-type riboflavin transporter substrate-binding protein n=1 Tax=Bacillus sp. 179-C3.3 HS TaxID=3232162 RepID=UPI0039A0E802